MPDTRLLNIKIFADGAEQESMFELYKNPLISGFTTNPTLMRKAGVTDYRAFAEEVLHVIKDRPISFEVFSDDLKEMQRQALEISSWGENVYVKIPITNTLGVPCIELIESLSDEGVKVNVTAIMTREQIYAVLPALKNSPGAYVSVFAGRIADTGRDPIPMMKAILDDLRSNDRLELIWASPREVLNVIQADEIGCHIITVTNPILQKLQFLGKDLNQFSLETVQMFQQDAEAAGYTLETPSKFESPLSNSLSVNAEV